MVELKWLEWPGGLAAAAALRGCPAEAHDAQAFHLLAVSGGRPMATGRAYPAGDAFYIDMLAAAPDADPECLVLVVQTLVARALESGAGEVYSPAAGALRRLLLAAGFFDLLPGEEPSATVVFRPARRACEGCGARGSGGPDGGTAPCAACPDRRMNGKEPVI